MSSHRTLWPPRRLGRQFLPFLPALLVLLTAGLVAVLMSLVHSAETQSEQERTIKDVLWVEQDLRFLLTTTQERMAGLAQLAAAGESDRLQRQAGALLNAQGELSRIRVMDAGGTTTLSIPPISNPAALARGESQRQKAVATVRALGRATFSLPFLTPTGDMGLEVVAPVFNGQTFVGAVSATLSLDALLTRHIPWWFAENYRLEILDTDGVAIVSTSRVGADAASPAAAHTMVFDPPGGGLYLRATPYPAQGKRSRWLILTAIAVLTVSTVGSLVALARHIRRRLKAEQALREEIAFRRAMENSLTVGMRARDMTGRITYVNPAFCAMTGYSPEELIGMTPPMAYWDPAGVERAQSLHDAVLAGNGPSEGFELSFLRRDGSRFDVLVHETPLVDASGRQTGWMGSFLDISDRKQMEDLARRQDQRLQHTSRLITMGEMASSLAHEINQPLAAVASYATGCLNRLKSGRYTVPELTDALDKLDRQAKRAGKIVRHMHDFARKSSPNLSPLDMAVLVREAVSFISRDAVQRGVRLSIEPSPPLPPVIADRVQIEQVLLNLIRNAIDASPPPRSSGGQARVVISTGQDGTGIVVRVRDYGGGIPAETVPQLFTPFFTTKPDGMGMGLSICRSIIEAHHGHLWYEQAEPDGGGTVFCFTLPCQSLPAPKTSGTIPEETP